MHSTLTKAAGRVQVVAKPHQRACVTQQEACLFFVRVSCVTSNCIPKIRHDKDFTACLQINDPLLFFLLKESEYIGQILRNGTRGRFGPVGHIFQKSHYRLRNYFIEEHFSVITVFSHWKHGRTATGSEGAECYLALSLPVKALFSPVRLL